MRKSKPESKVKACPFCGKMPLIEIKKWWTDDGKYWEDFMISCGCELHPLASGVLWKHVLNIWNTRSKEKK